MTERGSNAFAVAPARSGDGVTRLFINSHQPLTGPVAWYEAHMISREGMDMQGGLFRAGGKAVQGEPQADQYLPSIAPEHLDRKRGALGNR